MLGFKKPLKNDMMGYKKPLGNNMLGFKKPLEDLEKVADLTKKLETVKKAGGLERVRRNVGSKLGDINA